MTVKQTLSHWRARRPARAGVRFALARAAPVRGRAAPWYPVVVKLDDHLEVDLGWRTSVEQVYVSIKDRH
jgi:hypothetical protein